MFNLISKRQCVGQPDKPVLQVCSGWSRLPGEAGGGVVSLLTFRMDAVKVSQVQMAKVSHKL